MRGIFVFCVIFAAAVITMVALPSPWAHLLMFAAVLWFIPLAVLMTRYRCPACGTRPVDEEGDQTLVMPRQCSKCGVKLR